MMVKVEGVVVGGVVLGRVCGGMVVVSCVEVEFGWWWGGLPCIGMHGSGGGGGRSGGARTCGRSRW